MADDSAINVGGGGKAAGATDDAGTTERAPYRLEMSAGAALMSPCGAGKHGRARSSRSPPRARRR